MTFNDFDGLFGVKFCFRAGLAGWDRATSENNCVKTNKDKPVGELACALRGFLWTVTICDKWHRRPHDHKFRNICCPQIWSFEIFQDGGRPNLAFGTTGSRSSRSAIPENPTIVWNTKSIGLSVAEIWPFEMLTLTTSLMTSQGPDQKSVKKNYFP